MINYSDFLAKIQTGETTCVNFTNDALKNIKDSSHLNAFLYINENAIIQAEESDKRFQANNPRKLEGMLVALKDNISTKGITTTCGSKILEKFVPVYDATVVRRLMDEGAIIVGKTNMDEFAMGSSNENSYFGNVSNPHNTDYVPGGSSGGSAVAVASGFCHVALGSDTGGSIRQPAAFCGNVGIKPTYGKVSRYGLIAFASSLDQIGLFSSNIEDCSRVLDVISGKDEQDSTSVELDEANSFHDLQKSVLEKMRIAIIPDEDLFGCDQDIINNYHHCMDILREAGAELTPIKFKNTESWIPTYYILATAEASSNLARFDGIRFGFRAELEPGTELITSTRSQGFGPEVKRRIMLGTYVLSSGYYDAYYKKAQQARRLIFDNYNDIFKISDIIFMPTTPTAAFKKGEKVSDPLAMYLSDFFTASANLAGIPAISIPSGKTSSGLPIGMQLQAKHFDESKLLIFAKKFEQLFSKQND